MSFNDGTNYMDEDVTQEILEEINGALLMCPSFDFTKIVTLSNDINSDVNRKYFAEIIAVTFLKHLGMDKAADRIFNENSPLTNAYASLHLDDEAAQKWFIRFLAFMNPSLISSISKTIIVIMQDIMIKNTRTTDADRMDRLTKRMTKLIASGEINQEDDDTVREETRVEKPKKKNNQPSGITGWIIGTNKSRDTAKKRTKSSSSNSVISRTKRDDREVASKDNKVKKDTKKKKSIRDVLYNGDATDDDLEPTDSISQVESRISEESIVETPKIKHKPVLKRKVLIKEDSVVSD